MKIRHATPSDRDAIRRICLSAFPESEREIVAALAVELLDEQTDPPVVSLVAEDGAEPVGHIAISPVTLEGSDAFRGYILAPLAVTPDRQNQRIGSQLVERSIDEARTLGAEAFFVYGDPAYYGRFGFTADHAVGYDVPYTLQYPFGWLGMRLRDAPAQAESGTLLCVGALSDPKLW